MPDASNLAIGQDVRFRDALSAGAPGIQPIFLWHDSWIVPGMHATEERALVERARSGNRKAVDRLLAICYPRLLRTARSLLGNLSDAQDAAQDAAIAVFQKLHQLKDPEAFGGWANTVVRRTCSEYLRRRQLIGKRTAEFDELSIEHSDASHDRSLEARTELEGIFDQADESMKVILTYRLILGLSVSETATVMGLSEGAVKLRLLRARRKVTQLAW